MATINQKWVEDTYLFEITALPERDSSRCITAFLSSNSLGKSERDDIQQAFTLINTAAR